MDTLNRANNCRIGQRSLLFVSLRRLRNYQSTKLARVIGRQFLRSGTSPAANYRAAYRARSSADFISKISVVSEEADETLFWLELLIDSELITTKKVESQMAECEELLKIFSASLATAKQNR